MIHTALSCADHQTVITCDGEDRRSGGDPALGDGRRQHYRRWRARDLCKHTKTSWVHQSLKHHLNVPFIQLISHGENQASKSKQCTEETRGRTMAGFFPVKEKLTEWYSLVLSSHWEPRLRKHVNVSISQECLPGFSAIETWTPQSNVWLWLLKTANVHDFNSDWHVRHCCIVADLQTSANKN